MCFAAQGKDRRFCNGRMIRLSRHLDHTRAHEPSIPRRTALLLLELLCPFGATREQWSLSTVGTRCGLRIGFRGIVTLTQLVFDRDPEVASAVARYFL
jgi:hypothetical protein